MNHKSQVCSLELSQKLFTLGVKQNSIFVWEYWNENCYGIKYIPFACVKDIANKDILKIFSAYTVAELGEMLPANITVNSVDYRLEFVKGSDNRWLLAYVESNDRPPLVCIIEDNEANARAKMLIYLIENKLMEAPK